jgi:hypothetical protein
MPLYRFRVLDNGNRVIGGQYSHCKDDVAAREHADILAAQVKGLGNSLSVKFGATSSGRCPRKRPEALTPEGDRGPERRPSGWHPYRFHRQKDTA